MTRHRLTGRDETNRTSQDEARRELRNKTDRTRQYGQDETRQTGKGITNISKHLIESHCITQRTNPQSGTFSLDKRTIEPTELKYPYRNRIPKKKYLLTQINSIQLKSTQLNSNSIQTELYSTQLSNSIQLNSIQLN